MYSIVSRLNLKLRLHLTAKSKCFDGNIQMSSKAFSKGQTCSSKYLNDYTILFLKITITFQIDQQIIITNNLFKNGILTHQQGCTNHNNHI